MLDIVLLIKILIVLGVLKFAVYGLKEILKAERNARKNSRKRGGD